MNGEERPEAGTQERNNFPRNKPPTNTETQAEAGVAKTRLTRSFLQLGAACRKTSRRKEALIALQSALRKES
ncbi:hypothetical protein EYF80_055139 [Liparis tanakae]|uniref:Uncharacterized protein n=1 Tax=Liparis tanakae TaxID=230148 RepID=A0A4Z2F1F3_9TELE|nr:hypothetical protein EYF80_055139 [Liparis tanakae]